MNEQRRTKKQIYEGMDQGIVKELEGHFQRTRWGFYLAGVISLAIFIQLIRL